MSVPVVTDMFSQWSRNVDSQHLGWVGSCLYFAAGLLFDWLYPAHFPVILLCLEAWADTPEVTTALLRFMAEFVMNKSTRLAFDSSSPNSILLFREVSKVCCLLTWSVLLMASSLHHP